MVSLLESTLSSKVVPLTETQPIICMAIAILAKFKNPAMILIQSYLSIVLYAGHSIKQVSYGIVAISYVFYSPTLTPCRYLDEWFGFKIVGDNIDKNVCPQHQTIDTRTQLSHYFHAFAVLDRIDLSSQSEVRPDVNPHEFDLQTVVVPQHIEHAHSTEMSTHCHLPPPPYMPEAQSLQIRCLIQCLDFSR